MANTIQIKRGANVPDLTQLESYELGYVNNGNLYIRETIKDNSGVVTSDKIVQLTGLAATGLVNTNNYLKLPAVAATTSNTGRILVTDSTGIVYYKTPANIRSEIGALSTGGGTISGDVEINGTFVVQQESTFNGNLNVASSLLANGAIVLKEGVTYGFQEPNEAGIPGVKGQIYFLLSSG